MTGNPNDTPDFKYVTYDKVPDFTEAHKSAMAKHLTPEIFAELKTVRSNKGYTLSNAIQTGVVTPHLGVGITAGDEDSWDKFKVSDRCSRDPGPFFLTLPRPGCS